MLRCKTTIKTGLQFQKGVKNTNPLKKNQKGLAGFFLSILFLFWGMFVESFA